MNKTLTAALTNAEYVLVAETERPALEELSEDELIDLHTRIRRARNKYVGQYRRGASAKVAEKGGRGAARPANRKAVLRAEAFEEALSRVSRRLGAVARQAAADLKAERLESARSAKTWTADPAQAAASPGGRTAVAPDRAKRADTAARNRPGTTAGGARTQAKRDAR